MMIDFTEDGRGWRPYTPAVDQTAERGVEVDQFLQALKTVGGHDETT